MSYKIRSARMQDLTYLPAIETSAGQLFITDPELAWLTEDDSMSVEQHEDLLQKWKGKTGIQGGTWVVVHTVDNADYEEIVGFISTSIEGGDDLLKRQVDPSSAASIKSEQSISIHIHELGVHASHQRRGLAKALIQAVKDFASAAGIAGLSLTTIRDVPWNGPFYERQGFEEVDPIELETSIGVWARSIWQEDQTRFESVKSRRCFMICKVMAC